MSEPTGPKELHYTKVRFQERAGSKYISANAYTALKHFASSTPHCKVTLHEFTVLYELPPNQVIRPQDACAKYFIEVDEEAIVTNCSISVVHHTESVPLKSTVLPNQKWSIEALALTKESTRTEAILIKENAKFTDVTVYTAHVTVELSDNMFFVFREAYKAPVTIGVVNQEQMSNLYFASEPVYEAELFVRGWGISKKDVLNTLCTFLPLLTDIFKDDPVESCTGAQRQAVEAVV